MSDQVGRDVGAVVRAEVRTEPWSCEQAVRELTMAVTDPAAGAVVTFVGTVRDRDQDQTVTRLDYTGHPTAHQALAAAVGDVVATLSPAGAIRAAAVHRVGELAVGDPALVVAVSSQHRAAAFQACAAVVDQIKATVPIWKHEVYADGSSQWVGLS